MRICKTGAKCDTFLNVPLHCLMTNTITSLIGQLENVKLKKASFGKTQAAQRSAPFATVTNSIQLEMASKYWPLCKHTKCVSTADSHSRRSRPISPRWCEHTLNIQSAATYARLHAHSSPSRCFIMEWCREPFCYELAEISLFCLFLRSPLVGSFV